jgi:peroxiredoxin
MMRRRLLAVVVASTIPVAIGHGQVVGRPTVVHLSDHGTATVSSVRGWFHAERRNSKNELIWYVVLANRQGPDRPRSTEQEGILTISGPSTRYLLKDNGPWLRLLRVPYTGAPDDLMKPATMGFEKLSTWASQGSSRVTRWRKGDWIYIGVGDDRDRLQVFVRFVNSQALKDLPIVGAVRGSLYATTEDKFQFFDDASFLSAVRMPDEMAASKLTHARIQGTDAPDLSVQRWLNVTRSAPSFRMPASTVVLLDFWGVWCTPCVAHMPQVQAFYERFSKRGVQVVAVHSAWGHEKLGAFLREKKYSMPIAVDAGPSAERYAVETWPSFFLIDKDGKVRSAYKTELPTDDEVEQLLAK